MEGGDFCRLHRDYMHVDALRQVAADTEVFYYKVYRDRLCKHKCSVYT